MQSAVAQKPSKEKDSDSRSASTKEQIKNSELDLEAEIGLPIFLKSASTYRPSINSEDDEFEREADRVADAVAQDAEPTELKPTREVVLRRSPSKSETSEPIIKSNDPGSALHRETRSRIESRTGEDLGHVRVYEDSGAKQANKKLNSRAFAHGSNIWLGAGESQTDIKLMAHEATHVVQQGKSKSTPKIQRQQTAREVAEELEIESISEEATESQTQVREPLSIPDDETLDPELPNQNESESSEAENDESAEVSNEVDAQSEVDATEAEELVAEQIEITEEGGEGAANNDGEGDNNGSPGDAAQEMPSVDSDDLIGGLQTDEVALIDTELAEHQRWGAALERVGTAQSLERAEFVAEAAGGGLLGGLGSGAAMGLGMGLAGRAAARFIPVPGVGGILSGAMSVYGLASRDWSASGATISNFGEGASTYETLANSIAAIAEIIDVVSNVLGVVEGIVGVLQIAVYAITAGAGIATVLTLGAAGPVLAAALTAAETLTTIALALGVVTTALDLINAGILQPAVLLFRALHAFTSEADPREVEAQGADIGTAAGAIGGAVGGAIGARGAAVGGRPRTNAGDAPNTRPHADSPVPAAGGNGPSVRVEMPRVDADGPSVRVEAPRVDTDVGAPTTATGASRPAIRPPADPDAPVPDIPAAPRVPEIAPTPDYGPAPGHRPAVDPLAPTIPVVDPHAPTLPAPAGASGRPPAAASSVPPSSGDTPGVSPSRPAIRPPADPDAPVPDIPAAPRVPVIAPTPDYGPAPGHRPAVDPLAPTIPVVDPHAPTLPAPAGASGRPPAAASSVPPSSGDTPGVTPSRPAIRPPADPDAPVPDIPAAPRVPEIAPTPDYGPAPGHRPAVDPLAPTIPVVDPHAPTLPAPAGTARRPAATASSVPASSGEVPGVTSTRPVSTESSGVTSADSPELTGMRTETIGDGDLPNITDADVDAFVGGIEANARSDTFFELPGRNPTTGGGLQPVRPRGETPALAPDGSPQAGLPTDSAPGASQTATNATNPNAISFHDNHYFTDVGTVRIADAADVPVGASRGPGSSVIPADVGTTAAPLPQTRIGGGVDSPNVEVRYHAENPGAPAGSYSAQNPTAQINTPSRNFPWAPTGERVRGMAGRYLLPDGTWVTMGEASNAQRAAAHLPVGGRSGVPDTGGSGSAPPSGGGSPPPASGSPPPSSSAPPVASTSTLPTSAPDSSSTPVSHQADSTGTEAAAPHVDTSAAAVVNDPTIRTGSPASEGPVQLEFQFETPDLPQGTLRPLTAPLRLAAIGDNAASPVPQGVEPGAIGHYDPLTSQPDYNAHPFALESNTAGAPGASRRGGRMPSGVREQAGVFAEHPTADSIAHEVLSGHERVAPSTITSDRPGGRSRSGHDTRHALTISLPTEAKAHKDAADAARLADVRARQQAGEEVPPIEAIVEGNRSVQDAIAHSGVDVPEHQVTKAFLGEIDEFQGDRAQRFGYEEFRQGDTLPADHPLSNLTDVEISHMLDQAFSPFVEPDVPAPVTSAQPPGEQFSFDFDAPSNSNAADVPTHSAPVANATDTGPAVDISGPDSGPTTAAPTSAHDDTASIPARMPEATASQAQGEQSPAVAPAERIERPNDAVGTETPEVARQPTQSEQSLATEPLPETSENTAQSNTPASPISAGQTLKIAGRAGRQGRINEANRNQQQGQEEQQESPVAPQQPGLATQLGQLFVPQAFAPEGDAPTQQQREDAHRGRFAEDAQAGNTNVERVNPDYPPPPGTPQQLEAIQQEIENILAARAQAEQAEAAMESQEEVLQADQAPIQQAIDGADGGITAVQAHQQAVTRRQQVNREQQQRQQETGGLVSGYPSRAAGLATLTIPLNIFAGFTSLGSHLPGAAGAKMAEMNQDAVEIQDAFTRMGVAMVSQEESQPERQTELSDQQSRIETTNAEATATNLSVEQSRQDGQVLQQENEAQLASASQARSEASDQGRILDEAAAAKQTQADSLTEQLQAWAAAHKAARHEAVEATAAQLEADGYVVLEKNEG